MKRYQQWLGYLMILLFVSMMLPITGNGQGKSNEVSTEADIEFFQAPPENVEKPPKKTPVKPPTGTQKPSGKLPQTGELIRQYWWLGIILLLLSSWAVWQRQRVKERR